MCRFFCLLFARVYMDVCFEGPRGSDVWADGFQFAYEFRESFRDIFKVRWERQFAGVVSAGF
jgi:hypothetical protein